MCGRVQLWNLFRGEELTSIILLLSAPARRLPGMAASSSSDTDFVSLMHELASRHDAALEALRQGFLDDLEEANRQFHVEHSALLERFVASATVMEPLEEDEEERAALLAAVAGAAEPSPAIDAALVFMAKTVCRAVEKVLGDEGLAFALEDSAQSLAIVYDRVRLAMNMANPLDAAATARFKHCLLVVRDLLIVRV